METTFYRLSPQQLYWVNHQTIEKQKNSYFILESEDQPDLEKLQSVIKSWISTFPVLRTCLKQSGTTGNWIQQVNLDSQFDFSDRGVLEDDGITLLISTVKECSFTKEKDKRVQVDVFAKKNGLHYVLVSFSSITLDAPSIQLAVQWISNAYEGKNQSPEMIGYIQYSEWQNNILDENEHDDESILYWKQKTAENLSAPEFTLRQSQDLPANWSKITIENNFDRIPNHAEALLGACWQLLLFKYSANTSIASGHIHHDRDFEELTMTLGYLSRCLPITSTPSDESEFSGFLEEYEKQLETNGDKSCFFSSLSTKQNDYTFEYFKDNSEKLNFRLYDYFLGTNAGAIHLTVTHRLNTIQCSFQFDETIFTKDVIHSLASTYLFLVSQVSEKPDLRIKNIKWVQTTEAPGIDVGTNQSEETVVSRFRKVALNYVEKTAVIDEKGELSYSQLDEQSTIIADVLLNKYALSKSDRIAVVSQENNKLIAAMMGVLKAGGVYVPIDLQTPSERIEHILNDCGAKFILADYTSLEQMNRIAGEKCLNIDSLLYSSDERKQTNTLEINSEDPCYIIYTSGTTGKPKGVVIPHKALVNYTEWLNQEFEVNQNSSSLLMSSYSFDLGYTSLWGTLLNGGCLHLINNKYFREPDYLLEYIVKNSLTFVKLTPSLLHVILQSQQLDLLAKSNLQYLFTGGETIRPDDLKILNGLLPELTFINHYGPTETTIGTIAKKIRASELAIFSSKPTIGKPAINTDVYVLDAFGNEMPAGIRGEICIGGAGLAIGYFQMEELTEQRFVSFNGSKGLCRIYKTGDIGYKTTDGEIYLLGRSDDQVKIRGFRVELQEVQNALMQHEKIQNAVVITIDKNPNEKELAAFYVSNESIEQSQLTDFLKSKLPDPMIPAYQIRIDSIPLQANGKVDRNRLPEIKKTSRNKIAGKKPESYLEKQLASLWCKVLEVEEVGTEDNFFDLGGHSLKAIQLLLRIQKEMKVKVDLVTFFAYPTIKELVPYVSDCGEAAMESIGTLPEQDFYPLSHAQKRIWVASQFEGGSNAYNVPSVFLLNGTINVESFQHSFQIIIEKNEILRTVIAIHENEPFQKIQTLNDQKFKLDFLDWRTDQNKDDKVREFIKADALGTFDFANGPLLRASLIQIEETSYVLTFNIHHIISDGWSRGLLASQLMDVYQKLEANAPLPSGIPAVQYKEYAAWHKKQVGSQAQFWEQQFAGGIPVLDFPLDHKRSKTLNFSGSTIKSELNSQLMDDLTNLASETHTSLNTIMFAALGLLISEYSGQNKLVIGSLVSGRTHPDLEKLLGVFINFLPILIEAEGTLTLSDFLDKTHHTILNAYQNQDYPFDLMVEHLQKERDLSRNPFFDILLNFHWENDIQHGMNSEKLSDITVEPYDYQYDESGNSGLDIKLDIIPIGKGRFELWLSYNNLLLDEETMQGFRIAYIDLLEQIAKSGERVLSDLTKTLSLPKRDSKHNLTEVVLCSSFVIDPVSEVMEYWNEEYDLNLSISLAPYNQIFQQLLNPDSQLRLNPGINVLFIRPEDWINQQKQLSESEQIKLIDSTQEKFMAAFNLSREITVKPCFVVLVEPTNSISATPVGKAILSVNEQLKSYFDSMAGCYQIDVQTAMKLYEVEQIFDETTDQIGHMPFTEEAYAALATLISRKIRSWKTDPYKVIALDCDNTLWGGICGELGAENVVIDEHYQLLQQFMLDRYSEGFLLVLSSKNNEADVWDVFNSRSEMILKREHIAAYRINWEHKFENIRSMAEELNVSPSSFIFIDDSPFEIEQMEAGSPEILALELPENPLLFDSFLKGNWAFDRLRITEEDVLRNEMYRAQKKRTEALEKVGIHMEEFLKSLEIQIEVRNLDESQLERAVQLTQRTNQFNANGNRLRLDDIYARFNRSGYLNWSVNVSDKFGSYGLVGIILAHHDAGNLIVTTFLLSCRVLGKEVETALYNRLKDYAAANGLIEVQFDFVATDKNKPFEHFLNNVQHISTAKENH